MLIENFQNPLCLGVGPYIRTKDPVRAEDSKLIGVEGCVWSDEFFPPAQI